MRDLEKLGTLAMDITNDEDVVAVVDRMAAGRGGMTHTPLGSRYHATKHAHPVILPRTLLPDRVYDQLVTRAR